MQRSNFEDWVGDDEDDYYQYQDNRSRGGGRNKKKKKNQAQPARTWDWDDIYDPSMPNNYADYKGSEEQYREHRDWKARLHYHRLHSKKQNDVNYDSDKEEQKVRPSNSTPTLRTSSHVNANGTAGMFAPPPNLNFAPPSLDQDPRSSLQAPDEDDDYYPPSPAETFHELDLRRIQKASAPASAANDASGDDAYLRRMHMSGNTPDRSSPAVQLQPTASAAAPNTEVAKPDIDVEAKRKEALAKIAAFKAKLAQQKAAKAQVSDESTLPQNMAAAGQDPSAPNARSTPPPPPPPPVEESGATISRAPVRYDAAPPAPHVSDDTMADAAGDSNIPQDQDEPRSRRPGQQNFAERLMKKQGWAKGQGLGAQGEGITTALVGKVDKRKKLSDKDGGGWAQPANMGKIVGGKRRKVDNAGEAEAVPQMSDVIKLNNMLTGLDVQKEIEDNNLMQEIGDDFAKNYGNVERVFIWRESMGGGNEVFVKFTSQLSALRAVQGMDGTTFADNEVLAGFWDADMFEKGQYA